jgi:hypothetical protein
MDYKLIKENFERATENLMRGMPDDDSDFKADYTDLKFEEGSVESHILEAVKMVMKGQSSDEIIASLKAALDTLANDPGYMNVGTDDEPEEADYDTETGEFIGEEKKQYPGLVKGSNLSYIGAGIEKAGKTAADYIFVRGSMGFYAFPKDGEFPEHLRSKVVSAPSAEILNQRSVGSPSTYHKI